MYLIGGQPFDASDAGFAGALASAHALRCRPVCLCQEPGIEMYVARLAGEYLVK